MALENASSQKSNATIDIVKLIMAFLVVGIHTEPFGGVFWLDKGFVCIFEVSKFNASAKSNKAWN